MHTRHSLSGNTMATLPHSSPFRMRIQVPGTSASAVSIFWFVARRWLSKVRGKGAGSLLMTALETVSRNQSDALDEGDSASTIDGAASTDAMAACGG